MRLTYAIRLRHLLSGLAATLAVVSGLPVVFAQHGGDYERADIERGAQPRRPSTRREPTCCGSWGTIWV